MKILLTGGSGFLGSALALHLRQAGHEVALLLRPASSLARLRGQTFKIGRVAQDEELHEFVAEVRPDAVVHTACAYGRKGEGLLALTDTNLRLGLALLQALHSLPQAAAGPLLFINTGTALPAGTNAYALSKHQFAEWGEHQAHAAQSKLRFVNVELQHMYGAGDESSKFTTHVVHACHRNDPELNLTPGEQRRDFIYIDDVVAGYSTLLQRSHEFGTYTDVPLGSGQAPTIRDYVQTVHRLCGSRTVLRFGALPYRPTEAMHCQADLSRMARLGWAPRWSLEAGIERTLALEF